MAKLFITLASISGMLAVTLGAFGAHALKGRLDDYSRGVFETAVQYHFYHTLALLAVGILLLQQPQLIQLQWSGWAFFIGIIIFSGSLYVMTLTGARWLGAITPVGGVAFIIGWLMLALGVSKNL